MWRVQTRFVGKMAYLGCMAWSVLVLLAASAAVARIWKSSDGKSQVEADLVKSAGGKVTLRKPGGETITVDESRLCDEDRAYLRAGQGASAEKDSGGDAKPTPPKKSRTFLGLTAQANDCHSADEVLALYKEFLADNSIDDNELLSAKNNLPIWQSRATKKMVQFGIRWLEPEQVQKFKEKAAGFVEEAIQLVESKQFDKARNKLSEASREDPESLRANFLAGLIGVFGRRDLTAAKQEFSECVRRQRNHIPSLNNLALVEVRLQKYNEAIAHWKTALQTASPSGEISQNIGRLVELSKTRACPVPPVAQQRLGALQGDLSAQAQGAYNAHVGWLYMPLDPKDPNPWVVPDKDMGGGGDEEHKARIGEDRLCMRCGSLGSIKCPNKQCQGGKVPAGTRLSVAGTSGNGQTFYSKVPVFANCPVCGGGGKVHCPDCVNGIDKNLTGGSGPTVTRAAKRATRPQRKTLNDTDEE